MLLNTLRLVHFLIEWRNLAVLSFGLQSSRELPWILRIKICQLLRRHWPVYLYIRGSTAGVTLRILWLRCC